MNILQSPAWEKFQKSLNRTTFTDSGPGWSYLAILEHTPLGPYLFVPRGPSFSDPKDFKSALTSLKTLAQKQSAIFIRIEPELPAPALKNLQKVKSINPEHTWILDLSSDKSTLLANMKQNNRNLYNNHTKKGLAIEHTQDPAKIHHLTSLLQGVAQHNKINIFDENYLKKQLEAGFATLYLATYNKEVIAAALIYDDKTTRYYAHAAADYEHRGLSAGTILLAQIILDTKSAGKKSFDFWGIAPENAPKNHPWRGFTKFKKSFGGSPLTYPGTFDLVLSRPKYLAYTLVRPINLFLRRLIKPR